MGSQLGDTGGTNSGYIKVFKLDGTVWNQIGSTINGAVLSRIGRKISLNSAGTRLVAGGEYFSAEKGLVRVYEFYSRTNQWIQIGGDITSTDTDRVGSSVDINAEGNRIIVGSRYRDVGNPGAVKVLDLGI